MPSATIAPAASSPATSIPVPSRNVTPSAAPPPRATDDEILGIVSPRKNPARSADQLEFDFDAAPVAQAILPVPQTATSTIAPSSLTDADSAVDASGNATRPAGASTAAEPAHLRAAFDANPELRAVWRDAGAYRESFATPEAAREATALLADVNHMDALFFSLRPEDHAALARAIANLDPAAFASLANAMADFARSANLQTANVAHLFRGEASTADAGRQGSTGAENQTADAWQPSQISSVGARHAVPERDAWYSAAHSPRSVVPPALRNEGSEASTALGGRSLSSDITARAERDSALPQAVAEAAPPPQRQSSSAAQSSANDAAVQNQNRWQDAGATAANDAQLAFLNAVNAAAVEGVVAAIESQVERLLPEGVAKNARTRVVGEIYRELDATLRSNPQFAAQLRDAFSSGSLDDGHHRAIVSLLTGRARQALPGVAKRVMNEWTSTVVSAAHERRTRQRTAERRVDIAGSGGAGNDGRRSMSPRDLDYARLTDADILNL
jgi:hypothetical protein